MPPDVAVLGLRYSAVHVLERFVSAPKWDVLKWFVNYERPVEPDEGIYQLQVTPPEGSGSKQVGTLTGLRQRSPPPPIFDIGGSGRSISRSLRGVHKRGTRRPLRHGDAKPRRH